MITLNEKLAEKKTTAYVVGAWVVLMALTAASWWLGADHAFAGLGLDVSMIAILVLTFGKIGVVGHSFMEMREAAPWLSRTFFAWCLVMCVILSAIYLFV
jgi:cytochrome c oxidase subunit IV